LVERDTKLRDGKRQELIRGSILILLSTLYDVKIMFKWPIVYKNVIVYE